MKRTPCSFEGCEKPRRSGVMDVCDGHYGQRRRGQQLRPLGEFRRKGEGVPCDVADCDTPAPHGRYCSKHQARVKRHGDPSVVIPPADRNVLRGPDNPRWNADGSYDAIHQRIKRDRGPAKNYVCRCGELASQWAYVGPRNPSDRMPFGDIGQYEAMCVPCHKRFDLAAIQEAS